MAADARPEPHPSRAAPPTPIATAKGRRSAAVDDRALSEFLEASLKVPDLTLPRRRSILHSIDLDALRSDQEDSIRRLVASATETGAFGLDGSGVSAEDVRSAIEIASARVFGISDEAKGDGGRCFGKRRGGVWNELCWYRPMRQEDESVLEMLLSDSYLSLRKKLEDISQKLEAIAEFLIGILSEQLKNLPCAKRTIESQESLLRLRKYDIHHFKSGIASADESCQTMDHTSHALSLHISLEDVEFWVRSRSASISFLVPRGMIFVTIGKVLQEWSNNEFKSAIGEPLLELNNYTDPFFTLEFLCTPKIPCAAEGGNSLRSISLVDQILIVFVIALLYKICTYIF